MTTLTPTDVVDDERTEAPETPTADKVVDAAIACILDDGFYRASTNAIARRAGVTWGVIQHHFGTRDALMLAVVRRAVQQMDERFGHVEIDGETVEDRVRQMAEVIFDFYGHPEFLAYIQVIMNIGKDPRTADKTLDALIEVTAQMGRHLPRLRDLVLGEHAVEAADDFRFTFEAIRALAVNQQILRSLPNRATTDHSSHVRDQARLVDVIARELVDAIESRTAAA